MMAFNKVHTIEAFNASMLKSYRSMLQHSWKETYVIELGDEVAAELIAGLTSDDLGGLVPNLDEQVMVVLQEDKVIGSVICAERNGIIYAWGCYVLEQFQRQGIGRELMVQSVLNYNENYEIEITVLNSSKGAKKFYEKMGFLKNAESEYELLPNVTLPSITMVTTVGQIRNSK